MIRDFKCRECGRKTERMVKRDIKMITCPTCEGMAYKVPSTSNFVLKGEGFHANDYKKEKK